MNVQLLLLIVLFCIVHSFRLNILLDEQYTPKLSDFGFQCPLPKEVGSTSVLLTPDLLRVQNCRGYLASEFCCGEIGPHSDIFAYGIVSYKKNKQHYHCIILLFFLHYIYHLRQICLEMYNAV